MDPHDHVIPDDMDEGMAPPPLIGAGSDSDRTPTNSRPHRPLDQESLLAQLTSIAEEDDRDKLITLIKTLLSIYPFSGLPGLMEVFSAFLAPTTAGSFQQRSNYMQNLRTQTGSKCRCDAQWYAREGVDNIAFGCKTCAMSSASCICVACFEAGDHEGHDFYISRSDYGCCDCGDIYAWKRSGFCSMHTGPDVSDDPTFRLDGWTLAHCEPMVIALLEGILEIIQTGDHIEVGADMMDQVFEFFLKLAALHDGLRRAIGRTILNPLSSGSCLADGYLPLSHLFSAQSRQLWTKLLVDLMLDLEFKSNFSSVFAKHYTVMVTERVQDHKMSDIGDFTCQMFTRPDVAVRLVVESNILTVLLSTANSVIGRAMVTIEPSRVDSGPSHGFSSQMSFRALMQNVLEGNLQIEFVEEAAPPPLIGEDGGHVFTFNNSEEESNETEAIDDEPAPDSQPLNVLDHSDPVVKNHDAFQCTMDLLYIMDHPEVLEAICNEDRLLNAYCEGFVRILASLQFMNPHRRRTDVHMEFPDPNWAGALTSQGDLISSFWLFVEATRKQPISVSNHCLSTMAHYIRAQLDNWWTTVYVPNEVPETVSSLFCVLNRFLGLLLFEQLVIGVEPTAVLTNHSSYLIDLPVKARAFHSEASLGLWVRNGDSVNMETRFYSAPFFHHHMSSADLTAVRVDILKRIDSLPEVFKTITSTFDITSSTGLNGYLHLLAELMSQQTELALDEFGRISQRVNALLAVQDRTFSQLKDMKLERWTHTLTPKQTKLLEDVLAVVAEVVGEGPSYRLIDTQWLSLNVLSPFYGWREMQTAEERLFDHLKRKNMSLSDWFKCNQTTQPVPLPQFRDTFSQFLSSEYVLGSILLALLHAKSHPEDFRSLKLCIHIVLRLCYPTGPLWRSNQCEKSGTVNIHSTDLVGLSNAFKTSKWCHPWCLEINHPDSPTPVSILSLLKELEAREESAEMKQWLSLAISQISSQCRLITVPAPEEPSLDQSSTPTSPKETKRKRMQETLLKRLSKRQDAFLHRTTSSTPPEEQKTAKASVECVVCLGGTDRPVGTLAYIAQSSWRAFNPRPFIPTEEALQPASTSASHFLPFSDSFEDGHGGRFLTRTCGHTLHKECWTELNESQKTAREMRGFVLCPYCNRPANALLGLPECETETAATASQLVGLQVGASPIAPLVRLVGDQIDQLALSLRKPSGDTDLPSLERALALLVEFLRKTVREANSHTAELLKRSSQVLLACIVSPEDTGRLFSLFRNDWANTVKQIASSDKVTELAMKPWLYRAHVMWHYLVSSAYEMPFDEIIAVESMLSVSDEFQILLDQVPFGPLEAVSGQSDNNSANVPTLLCIPVDRIEQKYFDSFIKREHVSSVQSGGTRFVEYFPSIIPVIPSIYQKFYTAYLKAVCVTCNTAPRQSVVCLVCGRLLCLQSDCCVESDVGEVTRHYTTSCSLNGIGIFIQLSNAEVHLISTDGGRVMVAQWGSLYLDSHGEEDSNLSKPLQLSQSRIERLNIEIRENSWLWKQGSKNLTWRRPLGHL